MSSVNLTTITAPSTGLRVINNLLPVYAKLIGTGSGSGSPITVTSSNSPYTMMLALAPGSSGINYSQSTGMVTILYSGLYEVHVLFTLTTAASGFVEPYINGTSVAGTQGRCAQTTSGGAVVGTNIYNLTAGQTFYVSFNVANNVTIQNNPQDTFWYIRKIA